MRVASERELAEAIAGAARPLRVAGGGTRDIGRPVAGDLLEVGLSGVELYEPGALTLVVQAGTALAEVEAVLAGEGQRLAFEPMDHRVLLGTKGVPTIGGVVAGNVSGPRRVQAGAARDFALGARFVDGRGQLLKNGGRVMKNVTGYDLVKLLAGSWGTLGVLSEVSLKVLPVPETEASVTLVGLDPARAVAAMAAALGSPWEVTGAAHEGRGAAARTHLRLEGAAASVAYRRGRLTERLAAFGEVADQDATASALLWRRIRDVAGFADKPVVARVVTAPSALPGLLAELAEDFGFEVLLDWGGGLAWIGLDGPGAPEVSGAALIGALHSRLGGAKGHATLVKAPAALRAEIDVFQPSKGRLAQISESLKHKFDPRGILNPGLMGG